MDAGFRISEHTADLMLEAWGPTERSCLEQAALALVHSFASFPAGVPTTPYPVALGAEAEAALVALLDEVVYLTDARSQAPTTVTVERADGAYRAVLSLADLRGAASAGPSPKGITHHRLWFGRRGDGWGCRVVVDV